MPDQTAYSLSFPVIRTAPPPVGRAVLFALFALAVLVLGAIALAPAIARVETARPATRPMAAIPTDALVETSLEGLKAETSSITVEASVAVVPEAAPFPDQQPIAAAKAPPVARQAPAAPAALQPALQPPVAPVRPGDRSQAEGFVFVLEGQEWDEPSFANVEAALGRIPPRVRGQLGNRGLGEMSILVNRGGRALGGKQPYGGPANFYSTNDGRNELVLFPGQSVLTIMHELGHSYNLRRMAPGRYAMVLLDPEMQSFMIATGWRVLSSADEVRGARDHLQVQMSYEGPSIWPRLSNNDPLEDFANSFALYFFAPEELRAKSLPRFAWFEANVGR